MSNLIDIRSAKSRKESERLKEPSTPLERRLQEFATEVELRLRAVEQSQKRQDGLLNRILKRLSRK